MIGNTNTRRSYLQLENVRTRKPIREIGLRYYDKRGRLLNLVEIHKLICKKKHIRSRTRMTHVRT